MKSLIKTASKDSILKNIDYSLPATIPESMMKKLQNMKVSLMIAGRPPAKTGEKSIAPR